MKINSDKLIMDTLFIVEGEYEKTILKRIFGKIFGYSVIAQKNRDTKYLEFRKYDNGSVKGRIAVFCTDECECQRKSLPLAHEFLYHLC